jgi:hypothetical protein
LHDSWHQRLRCGPLAPALRGCRVSGCDLPGALRG